MIHRWYIALCLLPHLLLKGDSFFKIPSSSVPLAFPVFQDPEIIQEGSIDWNYIKLDPNRALRCHVFKMNTSTYSRQAVEIALQLGADVNTDVVDSNNQSTKRSLLFHAALKGNIDVVEWLIDKGAKLKLEKGGYSPFHATCMHRNKNKIAELLITHYPNCLELTSQNGPTPLHMACMSGNKEMVNLLLMQKPSFAYRYDSGGDLPFHHACRNGHTHLIKIFHVFDPSIVQQKTIAEQKSAILPPLYIAATENQKEVVQLLIELDQNYSTFGWTTILQSALNFAEDRCFTEIAKLLQNLKRSLVYEEKTTLEVIKALLSLGATPTLAAQWLTGTLPDSFPYCTSLLTQSNADPEKVAPFITNVHPQLPLSSLSK